MELPLQPAEASLLHRVLTSYLSDLRMEISNTEQYEFREELKADEALIKGLIARLEQMGAISP
jgi:hypothetical protein